MRTHSLPERPPDAARHAELEARDRPAGLHDSRELAQRRRRVVDVAQQVGERERVELAVLERQRRARRPPAGEPCASPRRAPPVAAPSSSISGALVDADDVAVLLAHELERDRGGAGGDVEHRVGRPRVDPRDEEAPPARVLAEREHRAPAVVGRAERREERRCASIRSFDSMALADDLERIARRRSGARSGQRRCSRPSRAAGAASTRRVRRRRRARVARPRRRRRAGRPA